MSDSPYPLPAATRSGPRRDQRSQYPSVRIEQIEPVAGDPRRVEVIARMNADQYLVIGLTHEQMEARGLVVGAWIRVAARADRFELA